MNEGSTDRVIEENGEGILGNWWGSGELLEEGHLSCKGQWELAE